MVRIDWSADSLKLQSCCGAHELLYWKLYTVSDASFELRVARALRVARTHHVAEGTTIAAVRLVRARACTRLDLME